MTSAYRLTRAAGFTLLVALLGGCGTLGIGRSTNLLAQMDPAHDAVAGRWEFAGRWLESEIVPHARIVVPVVPYGDYRVQMKFARVVGDGSANLILPVGDRQVLLVIAGWPKEGVFSGLETVDGRRSRDNKTTNAQFDLVNHRVYDLAVTVRTRGEEARVDADMDGRPFIRWRGLVSSLALPAEWSLPPGAALGVGAYDSVIQVHSLRVSTLAGDIEWME